MNIINLYRDYLSILPEPGYNGLWMPFWIVLCIVNIMALGWGAIGMVDPDVSKKTAAKLLATGLTFFGFWLPYVLIYGAPVIAVCAFVYLVVIVVEELL